MIWLLYIGVGLIALIFSSIFIGFIVAGLMDWYNYRRNRVLIELQRDYNKRSRPAAK